MKLASEDGYMVLVSIVIPVYNMGNKIKTCTKSIINQTYKNIEIILVDDGSKDNSFQQCVELSQEDNRIKVIHTENRGSGPARNEGIQNASGKYIYFPDADDYLDSNAIEILVNTMEKHECDLVVFGYRYVGLDGGLLSAKQYESNSFSTDSARKNYSEYFSLLGRYTIQGAPWNKFFSLKVIKENDISYPALRRHQDEGFIARYVNVSSKVVFIENILYTYYINDLGKQWDKYPVDYIEAVKGLYEERKSNVLQWNEADNKTHDLVYAEFICGFIKALELSFSPKHKLNRESRKKWILDAIRNSEIDIVCIPKILGQYQRMIANLIRRRKTRELYLILWIKVNIEKRGYLQKIKRIIKK